VHDRLAGAVDGHGDGEGDGRGSAAVMRATSALELEQPDLVLETATSVGLGLS
jgi:hypothetical protein